MCRSDAYNLNEQWISEDNQLIPQSEISTLLCPSNDSRVVDNGGVEGAATDYAFCKGDKAYLCDEPTGGGVFGVNSETRAGKIADGLSKTIAFGEAVGDPQWPAIPP